MTGKDYVPEELTETFIDISKNLFTLDNIRKICEENKINVLIYLRVGEINLFVNNLKNRRKIKYLEEIKPYLNYLNIYYEPSMIINGFVIVQEFNVEFFKDK